jgi:hypothetical protein
MAPTVKIVSIQDMMGIIEFNGNDTLFIRPEIRSGAAVDLEAAVLYKKGVLAACVTYQPTGFWTAGHVSRFEFQEHWDTALEYLKTRDKPFHDCIDHYSRQVMEKIDEIPYKTSVPFRPHIEQVRKLDL